MHDPVDRPRRRLWPALLPLLLAVLVYGQVGGFGFINFDDDLYVYENPRVLGGLSADGLRWALGSGHGGVWIPATWISLQLDAQLSGPGPGGFHRTNLALHLLNTLLVFLLVLALCGGRWRAAAVAAVFAAHPLNTEAVAWVTARKDLLMATWSLGAVLCWLRAAGRWRSGWAAAALVCAAVALAAKPQAVVLPLMLVLAVQWRRGAAAWTRQTLLRDALATLPFVALAGGVALAAVRLARGEEFGELAVIPFGERLVEASAYLWLHLAKVLRPAPLAPVYPAISGPGAMGYGAAAILAMIGACVFAWLRRRAWPALAFGWFWFLGWLLPTVGLVQGGHLPLGDRYAYLALVGIVFMVAEAAAAAVARRPRLRVPLIALLLAVVGLGALQARTQAGYWRDPADLWLHTLAVTRDNAVAHQSLAVVLDERGRPAEALAHLQASLAIRPHSSAHFNAGNVLRALGRRAEAEEQYRLALARNPALVQAALNLGSLLGEDGRLEEARAVLLAAEDRAPALPAVQFNLGLVAYLAGDRAEATARLRQTLRLDPAHAKARELLAQLEP